MLGPNEYASIVFPKAMSACYSVEFASLVPAEGHFLFCNGYNSKNSFALLHQFKRVKKKALKMFAIHVSAPLILLLERTDSRKDTWGS